MQRSVRDWQARLHPMAEFALAAQPSARVWEGIERQLNLGASAPETGVPAASYVATLVDDQAQPAMVITGDARRQRLTVRVIAQPAAAADKSLEPKGGSPNRHAPTGPVLYKGAWVKI